MGEAKTLTDWWTATDEMKEAWEAREQILGGVRALMGTVMGLEDALEAMALEVDLGAGDKDADAHVAQQSEQALFEMTNSFLESQEELKGLQEELREARELLADVEQENVDLRVNVGSHEDEYEVGYRDGKEESTQQQTAALQAATAHAASWKDSSDRWAERSSVYEDALRTIMRACNSLLDAKAVARDAVERGQVLLTTSVN